MAPSNAHILLSPKYAPADKDLVYEIVLGAGKNTFSTIRKLRTSLRVSTNSLEILNNTKMKEFWINIDGGTISVGFNNDTIKPLLLLKDPNPLDINYISFGAWIGVTATWLYDCKEISRTNVKGLLRLKTDLLEGYDTFIPPEVEENELIFKTSVKLDYIDLDLQTKLLTTNCKFNLTWQDLKIVWDPLEYDNITAIKLYSHQIWKPNVFIFNGIKDAFPIKKESMSVNKNGQIEWTPTVQLTTYCNVNVEYWPWDQHICNIRIGFPYSPLPFKFKLGQKSLVDKPKTIGSNWKVTFVGLSLIDKYLNMKYFTGNSNVLMINLKLIRNTSSLIYVFLFPIICSTILSQFSFILPPSCITRIYLHLVSLIINAIYLLIGFYQLPTHQTSAPLFVTITSRLFLLVALETILNAFIMNFAKFNEEKPPFMCIRRLLGNKSVRTLFLVPQGEAYNELEENDSNNSSRLNSNWFMFSIILDRIVFLISSIIIATPIILVIVNSKV